MIAKETPTLRSRVTQISVGAFLLASAVMLAGFVIYSMTKRDLSQKEIDRDLRRNLSSQVEALIPSFLLPEQSAGAELLLNRFKQHEELTHIQVVSGLAQLPKTFSDCVLDQAEISTCQSEDGRETAVVSPISEGAHRFGYLFKSKLNSSAWAVRDVVQLAGVFALMLGVTFITIYLFIARLLSRTVPTSLDRLVEWIEADLGNKRSKISSLPFRELESLRDKISEVMDRHYRDRDQTIIGHLTSGIMHDIKTPLQSVVTAVHLVEEQPVGSAKRSARLDNLFEMCRINIPLIGSIIESTLDGSRQIHIERRNADLKQTIEDALEHNRALADLRKVDVALVGPEKLLAPHDPVQLVRVLNNLLKNGIEAASERPSPKVRIAITNNPEIGIQVTVEDSGPGIQCPPDRVFRAFRSSKIHGAGLGLLVSKKIIEAHNGTISATNESSLGGAKFDILLPMEAAGGAAI